MVTTHNLGFPRIGAQRQLKFALEKFWQQELNKSELLATAAELRRLHWQRQQTAVDWVPVGDFSLYDHVLDMSLTLGNLPDRVRRLEGDSLDNYFRAARGRSQHNDPLASQVQAAEMTKWFDTNYHYLVPEFYPQTTFQLDARRLLDQLHEAKQQEIAAKPVIIGPVTYLWLGKAKQAFDKLTLLTPLVEVYKQLLDHLKQAGVEWVQIDEPILVTELSPTWQQAFCVAYDKLQCCKVNKLLTTYFGQLQENLQLAVKLPVQGLHVDALYAAQELPTLIDWLPSDRVLSLGVVDGRNIWKTDLNAALAWLTPIYEKLHSRLWLAPSCSLLHVPVDLDNEKNLDPEIRRWLAFAVQKLDEIKVLATALTHGHEAVLDLLQDNAAALDSRRHSPRVHLPAVKQRVANITPQMGQRHSPYAHRAALQRQRLQLPLYPTTTIGSFPQTADIRHLRRAFALGELSQEEYRAAIAAQIRHCVQVQEQLGLDVLVHGEAERNDMVEYFGEQLTGCTFTQHGWVQSYGSRCVKPPIIYGDVSRPRPMTVEWITYAQSLTPKPMKGMLTGPVTILNWSFVRDDQPCHQTCQQLALAIRDEVLDLEAAGIRIIQIDEAALREKLPLRTSQWQTYLEWAVACFRLAANGVRDETQIHTHMCYSEFNDIISAIADMDADVITIETSRSNGELLDAFDKFAYPNEIGPGVYDIHSPNIPSVESMVGLINQARRRIPAQRLWVNPDCGLKTRQWDEVIPALTNMVRASHQLRQQLNA